MTERHYQNEITYLLNSFKEKKSENSYCYNNSKIKNELMTLTKNISTLKLDKMLNNIKYNLKNR
ncbi:hypothetical protein FDC50_13275 [Clostridium botulinum]|nr:hypothetical protein KU41_17750 [Clostridium botulinum]MBY6804407.1 hypothetical protein [Clostridium botulinum]MBY6813370.1 hypothetical protein [Clostridium botulinum]MBY6821896.1 hypothetical protein [Clostridium botulinum]MBY7008860.1 hypothetical protein [Clostridium botulinum]